MQIDQNLIDEIVRRIDIVEYIGKSLKLKKSGNTYFASCPFHNEKSASFGINSTKQFFHCFGCGESGDVLTFTMKYNGLDFIDAVKNLASYAGVHIPENNQKISREEIVRKKQHKLSLNDTINKVVDFYQKNLYSSSIATNYLKNRGLNDAIIHKFLIGYTPNTANALKTIFPDYENNKFLVGAGITIKNDNGSIYERFRDRVMFPLRNTRGEVIAFGGRIIAHGEPKYLNSPETELFNKSTELYGLFESSRQIRDKNYAIVVEGYMDVIALFQFGVENVVATMGTAATEEHVKKLFNLCDDIYYCFDGDKAGFKAAWRALERSVPLVTDTKGVHFLFLPDNEDPDSYIRRVGLNTFTDQIKNHSLSLTNFLLKELSLQVNTMTPDGKAKLINLAKPYIEKINAVGLSVLLKQQLANLVELPANAVESVLNNRSKYAFYNNFIKTDLNKPFKSSTPLPVINSIELIISNILKSPNLLHGYNLPEPDNFQKYALELQELILLLDYIVNNYTTSDDIDIDEIESNCLVSNLNLRKIITNNSLIVLDAEHFKEILDRVFGFSKTRAVKIPRIPMKENT